MKTLSSFPPEKATSLDCDHPSTTLVRRVCSNGSMQVVRQCVRCGRPTSGPTKQSVLVEAGVVIADLPLFDRDLQDRWYAVHRASRDAERQDRNRQWWADYDRYLASPAWGDRRARVMARDSYLCQGCLEHTATEVHHLTYARAGNELLFDLIALCADCHGRAHGDDHGV